MQENTVGAEAQIRNDIRLQGWKEIATYIDCSVRSAQRLEAELGLPVRRPTEERNRGTVFAFRAELDNWLLEQQGTLLSSENGNAEPSSGNSAAPARPRIIRFGVFELDRSTGELRKSGSKIRLQEQPLRLLSLLVERPGGVVTREEIRQRLWPADTYVDFDRSLNTAASKLREALGDSAASPRFIETLPRRGYRFLASVESVGAKLGDARADDLLSGGSASGTSLRQRVSALLSALRTHRMRLLSGLALLAGVAIAAIALLDSTSNSPVDVQKFTFAAPHVAAHPTISPDGRRIAYLVGQERTLWVQDLDAWEPRVIEGISNATRPFWSPDSQWIGFTHDREVKKVSAAGGPPILLGRTPVEPWGGAWSPDGEAIVVSVGSKGHLYEVSARGGAVSPLLKEDGEEPLRVPHFLPLPGGRRVLLCTKSINNERWIVLLDLHTGKQEPLTPGSSPYYSQDGHVLFHQAGIGTLALPFALESLRATGEPFLVATDGWRPSVSSNGTLVYMQSVRGFRKLVWRDRGGRVLEEIATQGGIRYPSISPDETRIAVRALEPDKEDVWVHDVRRGVKVRLSPGTWGGTCPLWSPSGKEVVYSYGEQHWTDIFLTDAEGAGEAKPLVSSEWKEFATDWSADGKYILYDRAGPDERNDIWYLRRLEDKFEPVAFLESKFDQRAARFSPNGDYVAYVSNESGTYEVYVTDFPEAERKWKVSEDGGAQVRWSRDGKELYYRKDSMLLAVKVKSKPEFTLGSPEKLFEAWRHITGFLAHYDVSSDGQFLVIDHASDTPSSIRLVQNWLASLGQPQSGAR